MNKCAITVAVVFCFVLFPAALLFAGGEAEAGASATHGKYLAGQGIIAGPDDIHANSYIAQIDYNYDLPESGDFAVYTYTGNRQLSTSGGSEFIQIGLKAKKTPFEDLPPLNLAFVIDRSGSMNSGDKLGWVKESFDIFIEKVRDVDFVSLVTFESSSQVVFKSTRMDSEAKREEFRRAVHNITAGGGTNLIAGLENGYAQVQSNYRQDYSNRVLFLTDGVGESGGIIEMAKAYRQAGINVSTIGVGTNFDLNLMVDLAKAGGGSSRFISDRKEMKETFGDELDRMIVPSARNLEIHLDFPEYVQLKETWGYRNEKDGNGVVYRLPTLHNGDYETILAEIEYSPVQETGKMPLAELNVSYEPLDGRKIVLTPEVIQAEFVETVNPVYGVSDYTVLQSSTMLFVARKMIEIGTIYYENRELINQLNSSRNEIYSSRTQAENADPEELHAEFDAITSDEIEELEASISTNFRKALDITRNSRTTVLNNKEKLDGIGFDDELLILEKYIEILGGELELTENQISQEKQPLPLTPVSIERSLASYAESLFRELLLSFTADAQPVVAVTPFLQSGSHTSDMTLYLNESALDVMTREGSVNVVDRASIDTILDEQKLSLSGLVDTENALKVGELLSARYLVTGNVIPTSRSVIVFTRALNVENGGVVAVAQAVIPMTDEIRKMLDED